jgi:anti-anti-sigma factor
MLKPSPFQTRTEQDEAGARVVAIGELDLATSPLLEREIEELFDGGVLRELIVDLSALTFVDSSGLRLLIALNERAQAEGCRLALIAPAGEARTVFDVSGATEYLPFVESSEESERSGEGERCQASEGSRDDADDAPLVGEGMS